MPRPSHGVVGAALGLVLLAQWVSVLLLARSVDEPVGVLDGVAVAGLLPAATLAGYGIGRLLAGPLFGVWAASVSAFAPFAAVPLFDARYHDSYVARFLPQAVGLTASAAFVAAVVLAVAALAAVVALRRGELAVLAAAVAGVLAGGAAAVHEAAVLALPAPLAALAVARLTRPAAAYLVALLPGLAALGLTGGALPELELSWGALALDSAGLREYFWSVRMLEWLALAGALGAARRSPPTAALLAAWLAAMVVFRGGDPGAGIADGTYLPALLPALPAFLLLVAFVPLLVPAGRESGLSAKRTRGGGLGGPGGSPSRDVRPEGPAAKAACPRSGPGPKSAPGGGNREVPQGPRSSGIREPGA